MSIGLVPPQTASAEEIVRDCLRQLDGARTISVTKVRTSEEFPRSTETRFWFRKGGFFRAESGSVLDVANPKEAGTYWLDRKRYQVRPVLPATFDPLTSMEIDFLRVGPPVVGQARQMRWHRRSVIRVELDGRKVMTKKTKPIVDVVPKLFVYFDPKTHLPVGASVNLGSITQVILFEGLRLDQPIDDGRFRFVPPKGWAIERDSL